MVKQVGGDGGRLGAWGAGAPGPGGSAVTGRTSKFRSGRGTGTERHEYGTVQSPEERDRILRPHFTEWAKEFKVSPSGTGFVDENGNLAYSARAVYESDGQVWLSTLKGFDESGIQGHVEGDDLFKTMLVHAVALSFNRVGGKNLGIKGIPFRIIIQNIKPDYGKPVINVLFIVNRKQTAAGSRTFPP